MSDKASTSKVADEEEDAKASSSKLSRADDGVNGESGHPWQAGEWQRVIEKDNDA